MLNQSMEIRTPIMLFLSGLALLSAQGCAREETVVAGPPNIILVMADDMGWGQTGYSDHPVLKTPHLDAMAEAGLRFDRFYAGAPNCSPTRATVLTGRTNDRTGVENHGYALRRQERTLARALDEVGYATGHFGKWHLNGLRGAGVPVLASDAHHPGVFGFDTWLSTTNFFERDPLMSRNGLFVERAGDSSEVIVEDALDFIGRQVRAARPFFVVIWYGSPHSPWIASDEDRAAFVDLDEQSQHHYGELVAMDRSVGALRAGLRKFQIEQNTLVWFTSDNGGLPGIEPGTVGRLRGFKGSLYEGGLRVPAIVEWPAGVSRPRRTSFPAVTLDIFPTVASAVGLDQAAMLRPQDGIDLIPLFETELAQRNDPIGFRHNGRAALIDNDFKIVVNDLKTMSYEVYDLTKDPSETTDIAACRPDVASRLRQALERWNGSVSASYAGDDYTVGDFDSSESQPRSWMTADGYTPYLETWKGQSEYSAYIERVGE